MPEDARRQNRSLILRVLFRDGPHSRADLARISGLTPTTVSDMIGDLLEDGLVEEVGRRVSGLVGKPATLVGLDLDSRHIVCLDISDDARFVGGIVNLAGKVVDRRIVERRGERGDEAIQVVISLARDLLGATDRPILGIGIGSPGVVDPDGVVVNAAHLQWTGVPLARLLETALGQVTYVANDANAAVLAEYSLGGASGPNLLLVRVGDGLGAGLLLDNQLFVGDRFAAGEIGHVMVDERGALCACGRRGCLESAISVSRLEALIAAGNNRKRVLSAAGRRLGMVLATMVSTLNLDEVVLSGPSDILDESFRRAALTTIRKRTMPTVGEHVELRYSSLGEDDVLLGAAVLVLHRELGIA